MYVHVGTYVHRETFASRFNRIDPFGEGKRKMTHNIESKRIDARARYFEHDPCRGPTMNKTRRSFNS